MAKPIGNGATGLLAEVAWGTTHGETDDTRQWTFTMEQVVETDTWSREIEAVLHEFQKRLDPRTANWVTVSWTWL